MVPGHGLAILRQVVECRQRVRFATAELGDEGQYRCGVVGAAGQPPQYHARVLAQSAREAGVGEELSGIAVVFRRRASYHLFQGDGELVRVERAAFADFLARCGDFVPRIKSHQFS